MALLLGTCSKSNTKNNILENSIDISQENKSTETSIIPKEIIGTYLNEPYLNYLKETKSHIISINKVKHELKIEGDKIDEIIISEDRVLFSINLHEGLSREIESFDGNTMIVKVWKSIKDTLIIKNGNVYYNDINYIKVTDDITPGPRDKIGVKQFITNIIFGNKIYVNDSGDELYCLDNANIMYKNIEYEFVYSYMWQNRKYDQLYSVNPTKNWPPEAYWMEKIGSEVKIYTIILPDDPNEDVDYNLNCEYAIYDNLKEK
jgi:hypothetical protein